MWNRLKAFLSPSSANRKIEIASHERPLARVLTEVGDRKTEAITSLEIARSTSGAYLIMEGDWGGQIYLTVPVSQVRCSPEALEALLREIDSLVWECNDGEGSGAYFERHESGEGVPGGMGGAIATNSLWLHPELVKAGVETRVREVLFHAGST